MRRRVDQRRVRTLRDGAQHKGPILYWMGRDGRSEENWALLHAQEEARKRRVPLAVAFCLVPSFLDATLRHYDFLLRGLAECAAALQKKDIPFVLLTGDPAEEIPRLVRRTKTALLVTDFEPLRIKRRWKARVVKAIDVPVVEVDARNIVPCWIASDKQEYGARTIRPKIHRLLSDFLVPFPKLVRHPHRWKRAPAGVGFDRARRTLQVDASVEPVDWIEPGERAARRALTRFITHRLARYADDRNDPTKDAQSDLSPYLHFGQLSSARCVLAAQKSRASRRAIESFVEEIVIRRELSDNFCHYNEHYDTIEGIPDWGKKTLAKHKKDKRPYTYSMRTFERARTHDPLWNAAQQEMIVRGKMHGYLRMYWAKKLLEWTRNPAEAIRIAVHLNDRYELDGRDPNGYAGILWAIGGLHDRPWPERKAFGTVRFMNAAGCGRKFDTEAYIAMIAAMARQR